MSTYSKVIAQTDRQTHTQTDTHTDRHTHTKKTLPLPHTREVIKIIPTIGDQWLKLVLVDFKTSRLPDIRVLRSSPRYGLPVQGTMYQSEASLSKT